MKVFILEQKRDVHIRIYGIDGEQHTKEFFDAVFGTMSCVYPTKDNEHSDYGTEGIYTFESTAAFNKFCGYIEILQQTLDVIAEEILDDDSIDEYTYEYANYVV